MVFLPHSLMPLALPIGKGTLSVDEIMLEVPLNYFSICQQQFTEAFLAVLTKLTLVAHPVGLHIIKISTVERPLKRERSLVVKDTSAMELAIHPHAVIGRYALTVIENASPVDFSLLELTLIVGTVSKEQLTPTVLLTAQQLSVVCSSFLVQPLKKLYLLQTVPHPACLHLVLLLNKALLPRLEVLQAVLHRKIRNGRGFIWKRGSVTGRGQFEVLYGVEDRFCLGVEEGVLDGFLECALLELADIFQILPDHLQQSWISVDVLLVCLTLFWESGVLCRLLLLARARLHD